MSGVIANKEEVRVARAASKAFQEGKDIFAAARVAAKDATPAPAGSVSPEQADLIRGYALAVCRLGHGRFEHLSNTELIDVMCAVPVPFASLSDWLKAKESLS